MKKVKKIKNNILLHPMMTFILLIGITIVLSGILDLFDASVTYSSVNVKTGAVENTLVTVESLFSLSGLKYIFSNAVYNFASFTPLSMLLIVLIGFGILDESGFLDSFFFLLTKKMPKYIVTYIFTLLCMLSTITGDLSFIVFIPLGALLFKYGKRNPCVGIIDAFASVGLGYAINLTISSVDSELINSTELAARTITNGYNIGSSSYLLIMIFALIFASIIVTYITEKITAPKLGKYEVNSDEIIEDKETLTRREKRGLLIASFGAIIYLFIFIWNIIPNAPFGGKFLDYSQDRYIDMLFGYESFFNSGFVFIVTFFFFLIGFLYALGARKINNHRDICNYLSHSLDEIGKVIVLIFFASMFISLFKYTNIGSLITAFFANIIKNTSFGGVPLILLLFVISMITTLFLPSFVNRWTILSGSTVPTLMTAGFSPEFSQLIFSAGSSITYILTPVMAYFVIYISYIEKYNDAAGVKESISYLIPYSIAIMFMWLILILLWFVANIPLGIGASTAL